MRASKNRHAFLTYNALIHIKPRKLFKIADEVHIVLKENIRSIPLKLTRAYQKYGKQVHWIQTSATSDVDLQNQLSFLMGRIHENLPLNVEFAVMSNDTTYDALVSLVNESGRKCLRVQHKGVKIQPSNFDLVPDEESLLVLDASAQKNGTHEDNDQLIEETAKDTIDRLIKSGNRPAEVSTLKSYILLNNKESEIHAYLDEIIKQMESFNEIEINEGEVTYNF